MEGGSPVSWGQGLPVLCRVWPSSSLHLPAVVARGKALCGAMPVGVSSRSLPSRHYCFCIAAEPLIPQDPKHLPGRFLPSQHLDPPRWLEAKGDGGTPSPHLHHGSSTSRSPFPVLQALQATQGTMPPTAAMQPPRGAGGSALPAGGLWIR